MSETIDIDKDSITLTSIHWRERVASSLERIAERLADPNKDLVQRVSDLEDLLKEFVAVMENPDSTNAEWVELNAHVRQALGLDATA